MFNVTDKTIKLRIVMWIRLWNYEKVCKQLFLIEKMILYIISKIRAIYSSFLKLYYF